MYKTHVIKPSFVFKNSILKKNANLSPARHNYVQTNSNIDYLVDLIEESKASINVRNNKGRYLYVEIGDINTNTGGIDYKEVRSIDISSSSVNKLRKDDILISTVRTYLGGIGYVNNELQNLVATKALIVLRKTKKDFSRFYLFGVLRSRFFIEQVNLILNASVYPRMEKDNFSELKIPFPTKNNHQEPKKVENIASLITQNILDKEEQIKLKNKKIDELIEKELKENQNSGTFEFRLPKISEIRNKNRFDTGLYQKVFKDDEFLIMNYKNSYFCIDEKKIKSGSTPIIRIFDPKKSSYKWVTPTNITDQGFYIPKATIGMPTIGNLKKDAILIINRTSKGKKGEYVGISCFYDKTTYGDGQHNQGIYRVEGLGKLISLFIICVFNSKITREICGFTTIGSKMKEMKASDFSKLKIPNFPESKQKEIAKEYYNPIENNSDLNFENYLEKEKARNIKAGIFQLNMELFSLREKLEDLVDKIVKEEKIDISFDY